jgi:hypothetical protein
MVLHREGRLQNAADCQFLIVAADAALSWAALILVVIVALSPL